MFKAFIFDLEGVIIDSETIWNQADREFLKKFGIKNFSFELKSRLLGRSFRETTKMIKNFYHLNVDLKTLMMIRKKILEDYYRRNLRLLMPGTKKFLEKILHTNLRRGLATSAWPTLVEIAKNKFPLEKWFEVVVTSAEVKNCKPAPDIFLKTAKLLKVQPKNCLVFEDSASGIVAAKLAGMKSVALVNTRWSSKKDFQNLADYITETGFKDLNLHRLIK